VERKLAEAHQDHAHLMQVLRLVPLRDKAYELKAAGEIKVDGKPAVGLWVGTKGQKEITLFFDKYKPNSPDERPVKFTTKPDENKNLDGLVLSIYKRKK
jgi:hypothetical protein